MIKCIKFLAALILLVPVIAAAGPFSNPYNHFYFDLGAGAYYLQHPKFEVGTVGTAPTTQGNTTAPLAKIDLHRVTSQAQLAFGYWFMNCPQNWISMLFGHEEAMEVDADATYLHNSESKDNLGLGNVWKIDGSGSIFNPNAPSQLSNFKLNAKFYAIDTGVYFKGKIYTTNPRLYLDRAVGLVTTYYHNKYDYSLTYNQGGVPGLDTEEFSVSSWYSGVSIRHALNYQVTPYITPFASLDVQLLAIHASLIAKQRPQTTQPEMRVTDSETKFNYRGIVALGVKYKFTKSLTSPELSLSGGVDHWNYVPRVVPPNHAGDKKAHLHGETMNNGFVMLAVHVPFG